MCNMGCLDLHKDQHIMHHMVPPYMVIMTFFTDIGYMHISNGVSGVRFCMEYLMFWSV